MYLGLFRSVGSFGSDQFIDSPKYGRLVSGFVCVCVRARAHLYNIICKFAHLLFLFGLFWIFMSKNQNDQLSFGFHKIETICSLVY